MGGAIVGMKPRQGFAPPQYERMNEMQSLEKATTSVKPKWKVPDQSLQRGHAPCETQDYAAPQYIQGQSVSDTQTILALQNGGGLTRCETHQGIAPSRKLDLQLFALSFPKVDDEEEEGQTSGETQKGPALSLLNIYVQTYEQAQKLRLETMNRIRCWLRDSIPKEQWPCNDPDKSFKDDYIMTLPIGVIPNDLRLSMIQIVALEKDASKWVKREVEKHPFWPWLSTVRGMGPILAGKLLHRLGDLKRFPSPAHLWSYCGLDGPGWRQRPHNWALTSICFNIAESFQKQPILSGGYRDIYDKRKEYEATKPSCEKCREQGFEERCRPAHINNKARRYAVKIFLKDLWVEGQEVS
jgi:hypothetical protein